MPELDHPSLAPKAEQPPTTPLGDITVGDVTLTPARYRALADYLSGELTRSENETMEWRKNLQLWRDFVDPKEERKSFPWDNAANFFIPIPRTAIDSLKSSAKQAINRQREMFTAKVTSLENAGIPQGQQHDAERAFIKAAERLARDTDKLNFPVFLDNFIEEALITGPSLAKLVQEPNTKDLTVRGRDGSLERRTVTMRTGPRLFSVPSGSWDWPVGLWGSVQEMPWISNWVEHSASALRLRANDTWRYANVEKVISGGGVDPRSDALTAQRQDKTGQDSHTATFRTHVVYLDWDLHDDGNLHSVEVTLNKDQREIHRIIYTDGHKPYDIEGASPRSGTIMFRGIIEPIVMPCKAINQAVNQTFDAQTLANTPSLLYREDSETARILSSEGGFFPGIPLPYKEAKDELGILEFPDPKPTSFMMVEFFLRIVQQLTRVGPSRLGDISEGKRTPATLGLATQQIGAELIDEFIDRLRIMSGRLMERAFVLYHLDDPRFFERLLGPEDGQLVVKVIETSLANKQSLGEAINIKLSASSATRSVELERQNAMATAQLTLGWYRQVLEMVMLFSQVADPAVRQIMLTILQASETQMRRLVELADQADPETIVPAMSAILAQTPAPSMPTSGPGANESGMMMQLMQQLGGGGRQGGAGGGTPQA